jgi:hypothetical protein
MAAGLLAGLLKKVLMNAVMSKMGGGGQGQAQPEQPGGLQGLYMNATKQDPFVMGISEQEMMDRLRKMSLMGNFNQA